MDISHVPTRNLVLNLDHVAIAVENLSDAINWYTAGLGFELLEQRATTGRHTGMLSAVLRAGDAIVVLVQGTSADSQVSRFISKFGAGVQHMAFAVADLYQALESVRHNGGAADIEIIEGDGIRQVFLRRDPASGVRIELIERNGGTFTDLTVEQLFREFESRNLV
jgi:methylmalonyl-CoA epimerase